MKKCPSDPQIAISEQEAIKNAMIFNEKERCFYSPMPWKSSPSILGNNTEVAIKSHQNLKKKAHRNELHPPMIKETFQSMLSNEFIIKTDLLPPGNGLDDGLRNHIQSIPNKHFTVNTIVYKPSSTSTKTRITWDGTRKTNRNSPPINSILMSGNPQYNLTKMLLNWKLRPFALSTDISKFFNRIKVQPKDRPYLNILWTESLDPNTLPDAYTMLSHTFGYASTSAIARAAIDLIHDKSIARNLLELARALSFIYVDDVNTSLWSYKELQELKTQLKDILESHGFPVKGWAISNSKPDPSLSEHEYCTVGGWLWFSEEDTIQLAVPPIFSGDKKKGSFKENTKFLHSNPTHKEIMDFYKHIPVTLPHIVSRTAMLFDMSGMAAPLIVMGNYVARKALADTKANETSQVSEQTKNLFITYLHLVSKFGSLKFPRSLKRADQEQKATLLTFADSSALAWMVVIFLLRIDKNKQFFTEFLYSTGGLNPASRTIPRSELHSYGKAADVVESLKDILENLVDNKYLIADNKIAFYWILNRAKKASLYVQNRVFKVSATFKDSQLLWIPTHSNPADIGTRPASLEAQFHHLEDGKFFRTGPTFLQQGIESAIAENHLIPMQSIKSQVEQEIMDEILDIDPTESSNIDANSFDMIHTKQNATDSIMIINFSDPDFLSKVEQVQDFSNYLICPLKRNYTSFHMSLTVLFRAINQFLTPSESRTTSEAVTKRFQSMKSRIISPIGDNVFSITVQHSLPDHEIPDKHIPQLTVHDIQPLRSYAPHLPSDPISRANLLQWLKYPGILKIVRLARSIQIEYDSPASEASSQKIKNILITLTRNSSILASSSAGPVACSVTLSTMFSGVQSNRSAIVNPFLQTYLSGTKTRRPILKVVRSLITNPYNWPTVPRWSISQLFTAETIKVFSKVTDRYLNTLSSREVEHFIPRKTLHKIATKIENIWCAKNKALSLNSQLNRDLINPVLRFNKSPLTIALAKHSHTELDKKFINRSTSSTHIGWKENEFRFQKYGIIYRGSQIFKQIDQSCLQCEQRRQLKFSVHMGLAHPCIFTQIRIFRYIAADLKGPYVLPSGKSTYILVLICIQTKYCEAIVINNRSAATILEAFNVVFSLFSSPHRIVTDKEGGIVKIANELQTINDSLIADHEVTIEFIPAGSHHFSGLVERKIRQISCLLGTLDMTCTDMSEIKFCNTVRIIVNYLNTIPYLVQFVGGTDMLVASGINEYPIELQYISPLSWFNPRIENCFHPVFIPSINHVQQSLLENLGLLQRTYTLDLLPKLLLTLDRKRLNTSDSIQPGQMVLIHTSEVKNKHSKAVLAQVTEAKPGRDNVVRIVTLKYFKANSCKIVNNRLVGRPIFISRGVETLSRLNQSALQPCKVSEYLHRNCKVDHTNQDPVHRPGQDIVEQDNQEQPCNTPTDHSSDPIPPEELDPDHNTTIWIEESDTNITVPQPHARVPDYPAEGVAPLPDIETQLHNPQQVIPGMADQQSMNLPNEPQVSNQIMPTVPDNKTESLPDRVEEEVDEIQGGVEHTGDTTVDPDFVPSENTPVGDNQVRQLTRNRKPRVYEGFLMY